MPVATKALQLIFTTAVVVAQLLLCRSRNRWAMEIAALFHSSRSSSNRTVDNHCIERKKKEDPLSESNQKKKSMDEKEGRSNIFRFLKHIQVFFFFDVPATSDGIPTNKKLLLLRGRTIPTFFLKRSFFLNLQKGKTRHIVNF